MVRRDPKGLFLFLRNLPLLGHFADSTPGSSHDDVSDEYVSTLNRPEKQSMVTVTSDEAHPLPQRHREPSRTVSCQEQTLSRCSVCLEDVQVSTFDTPCLSCSRGACGPCMAAYIAVEARSRRWPIPCIHCAEPLEPEQCLRRLIPFSPEKLALEQTLVVRVAFDNPLHYCSNPRCATPFEYDAENNHVPPDDSSDSQDDQYDSDYQQNRSSTIATTVTCPLCQTETCVKCGQPGHQDRACAFAPEGLGTSEEALEALVRQKGWKKCPTCGQLTSKDSSWACNYCVCVCGTGFCFKCGVTYKSPQEIASSSTSVPTPTANMHGVPNCLCGLYS